MELAELANLIRSRRSIRRWQDKEIPEELLTQAISIATWAPSGGNQQNWHFYIIKNRDTINTIADAVKTSTEQIVSWPEASILGDNAARWRERADFFRSAPATIAVTAAHYQSTADKVLAARGEKDPQAARIREWRNIANSRIQCVSAAITNLLLVLHQMGLGAVWMTGPMQAKDAIEKALNVPPEMDLVAFIPVGYPAENPAPKGRRPLAEVCEIIR